jgi:uncharacterized membrane protein YgcG
VLDTANLLSPETIDHLNSANSQLLFDTGGEVLFYTMHFVPLGQDIHAYALEVFNAWGPGHYHNNGILVMIAAREADNNFWLVTGAGIEGYFTRATIERYLDTYFIPHFGAGDYDMAVTGLFNALSDSIYRLYEPVAGATPDFVAQETSLWETLIAVVIVIFLVFFSISRTTRHRRGMMGPMGGPMMPGRGGGWGRMGGGFMGGFLLGRGSANRQNRGGSAPGTNAPPPKPFGGGGGGFGGLGGGSRGGGGYSRGGGGYSRGGGGGISRGGGRRR